MSLLGKSRASRRILGVLTSGALIAAAGGMLLNAGGAAAATPVTVSVLLAPANPSATPANTGDVYYTSSPDPVLAAIPADATINSAVVSGTPDGTEKTVVDDQATITVNGGAAQNLDYTSNCTTAPTGAIKPISVGTGVNSFHVVLADKCGGRDGNDPMYVVVTYTPADAPPPTPIHTNLHATPIVASLASTDGALNVFLLKVSARLTDDAGHGIGGENVVFSNGGHVICHDFTGSDGWASCSGLDKTLGALITYDANFLGDGLLTPSHSTGHIAHVGPLQVL
jgi:hypothetical protein